MSAPTVSPVEEAQRELDVARARLEEMETELRAGATNISYEDFNRARGSVDYLERKLEGTENAARRAAVEERDARARDLKIKTRRALKRKGDKVLAAKEKVAEAIEELAKAVEGFNDEARKVQALSVELRLDDESLADEPPPAVKDVVQAAPHRPIQPVHPSAVVQVTIRQALQEVDTDRHRLADLVRLLDVPQANTPWREFAFIHEQVSADSKEKTNGNR